MVETAALADDLTFRNITISDGSNSNAIQFRYRNTSNVLQAILIVGDVGETYGVNLNDITTFSKTAIKYKKGDNGILTLGNKRNLITNSSEFYDLSYEYINDCLRAGLYYRREFYNDSELEAENSLMFKITLSSFGSVNSPSLN